jgi:DNA repair exonuclease SbcCD nuclease subunit
MATKNRQPRLRLVAHGDPHLERYTPQYFKNLIGNPDDLFISSIERLCDHAISKGIRHVVLLGDIADHPNPKQETIIRLIGIFNKFPGLKFWIITGNHDITARGKNGMIVCEFLANMNLLTNVKVYTQPKMEIIDGFPVYFMPYGFNEQPKGAYLGIGHHSVTGARMDSGYPVGDEGIAISNKRTFWVMGHLHEHQEYPWGVYAGTAYQINFGESTKKYFLELDAKLDSGHVTAKTKLIKSELPFRLKNILVKTEDELAKVKPFDKERKIFYKVVYDTSFALPKSFQTDNPHVLMCEPLDRKTGKELKITKAEDAPKDVFRLSPTRGLVEYLTRKGMDKDRAKAARRFVKTLIS